MSESDLIKALRAKANNIKVPWDVDQLMERLIAVVEAAEAEYIASEKARDQRLLSFDSDLDKALADLRAAVGEKS